VGAAKAITALRDHWDEVLGLVGDTDRPRLLALVERLAGAEDEDDRAELTLELLLLLTRQLPADHPVRRAIAAPEPRLATGTLVAETETALAELEVWLGIQQAKERLLAAPAYSADELRARGGDPDTPGLIRLRRTDRSIRLPAFQFDPDGAPLPVVIAVNQLLHADRDPWGVADWWLGRNARLGGVPASLVGAVPDSALVTAAQALRWEG